MAGTLTGSPVRGLRPLRASRLRTEKAPKPRLSNPVTPGQRLANLAKDDVHDLFNVFVTQVRVFRREFLYELGLEHRVDNKRICGGSARPPPQTFREI